MTTQRARFAGRIGLAWVIVAMLLVPAGAGARQVQAPYPYQQPYVAPAPAAPPYSPPQPAELYAANLGISYRLEPYGGSQGARLTRPPAPGSPAAQIQLEPGDLIIALDNQAIFGPNDVLNHVAQTSVQFVNIRTGQPQTSWVFIPTAGPTPPGGLAPPPVPWPGAQPYTLGVATMLTSVGNDQVVASPYVAPGQAPAVALRPSYGLRITQVVPGSAAQRAGLEVGDIIMSANGQPMGDSDALRRVIAASGGTLNLVVRDVRYPGREVPVYVALAPAGGQIYASPVQP